MGSVVQILALIIVLPVVMLIGNYLTTPSEVPPSAPAQIELEQAATPPPEATVVEPAFQPKSQPKQEVVAAVETEDGAEVVVTKAPTQKVTTPVVTTSTPPTSTAPITIPIATTSTVQVQAIDESFTCEIDTQLNNQTIGGIDRNNNLIRDDVECAIDTKYPVGSKENMLARRHAKAIQAVLIGEILYSKAELALKITMNQWFSSIPMYLNA